MTTTISGDTGVSAVQTGVVQQVDLAANVVGNGPAFYARESTGTSLAASGATKMLYATEMFDTNNNFASSRFTPTVAGYYLITGTAQYSTPGAGSNWVSVYKNGSEDIRGVRTAMAATGNLGMIVTGLVYLNGTTDYVEIYVFTNGGAATTEANGYFQGHLARAA